MINPDIQSLQDILLFGLKGVAAYADHAQILGKTDDIGLCVHGRSIGCHDRNRSRPE